MSDAEWLACTDPTPMLEFLRGKASDRKLRLYACAYARQLWPLLNDERSKEGVKIAEQYADGLASELDRKKAWEAASDVVIHAVAEQDFDRAAVVVYSKRCLENSKDMVVRLDYHFHAWKPVDEVLIRDIFGNPFRPITLDPSWLAPTVKALAQTIYTDRIFHQMPDLAEELERAGCSNQDILGHCRGPGPHVRGCWVLDLLLGKE
jgi:hypothetical protein